MAKYLVDYYETYSKSYEVEADSNAEAEEKEKNGIREGLFGWPENCSDSWCKTEKMEVEWYDIRRIDADFCKISL